MQTAISCLLDVHVGPNSLGLGIATRAGVILFPPEANLVLSGLRFWFHEGRAVVPRSITGSILGWSGEQAPEVER